MLHEVSNCTWTEKLVKRVFKDERSWVIMVDTGSRLELPKIEPHHMMVKPQHIMAKPHNEGTVTHNDKTSTHNGENSAHDCETT